MADRYWVGGSGNWSDDDNHWATSSGGTPANGNIPTASDNVNFDILSGTGTVTIDSAAVCLDFVESAASTITTFAGTATLAVSGSFTLGLLSTWSATGTITFNATGTGKTITTTGTSLSCSVTFNGSGGGWTLQDNISSSNNTLTLSTGTLDTNGKTVTVSSFTVGGAGTKTLTLGASTITVGSNGVNFSGSNLTFNANTSTFSVNGGLSNTFGTLTFNNFTITRATASQLTVSGSDTFANFTWNAGANKTSTLSFSGNPTTTSTFTVSGNSAINRLLVFSSVLGTTRTITAAAVSLTNVDFQDITGAGAATWSGTSVGNALGNSNITFTTPVTRYWIGGTGSWSATTEWAATSGGAGSAGVPLCHDTVIFDANSFSAGSQTVTADMPRLGAGIDFSAATNNPTLNTSTPVTFFGSLALATGMTWSASNTATCQARSSVNLTTSGVSIGVTIAINAPSGTVNLQDSFTSTTAITLNNGTLNTNNQVVSTANFSSSNSNVRALTLGSTTWSCSSTGTTWNIATSTNMTLSANTSSIVISETGTTSKTFAGGGLTYNNLTITGDDVTISGNNTFTSLTLNNKAEAEGTIIGTGSTQTITTAAGFSTNGAVDELVKLSGVAGGGAESISVSSGNVCDDFMNLTNVVGTGGATFYAGANSTDGTGNTGWSFTACPAVGGVVVGTRLALMGVGF